MIESADNSRLPALDGLRGFAALAVVLLHLTSQVQAAPSLPVQAISQIFSFGWSGVDLFFVLSGFLITGLLVEAKGSTNYFRVFYARRMLRILPLYYGALIVLFGVPMIVTLPQNFVTPWRDQLWFWFYLQNFHSMGVRFALWTGHLWSLAIEEQFYLVWPLVILLTSRKQALWVCFGLLLAGVSYRTYAFNSVPRLDTYYFTQARMDGLAIGSAIALLTVEREWLSRLRKMAPAVAIVAGVVFGVITFDVLGLRHKLVPLSFTSIDFVYASALVVALEDTPAKLANVLRSRFLRFYGHYSYALYVIHVPAVLVLSHFGIRIEKLSIGGSVLVGLLLYIAVVLPVVTLLAWLSWHLFEKHFLKLKRNFVYQNDRSSSGPSSQESLSFSALTAEQEPAPEQTEQDAARF